MDVEQEARPVKKLVLPTFKQRKVVHVLQQSRKKRDRKCRHAIVMYILLSIMYEACVVLDAFTSKTPKYSTT